MSDPNVMDLDTPDPTAHSRRPRWHMPVALVLVAAVEVVAGVLTYRHAQAATPPAAPVPATRSVVIVVNGEPGAPVEMSSGSTAYVRVVGPGPKSCEIDIDGKRAYALADDGPKAVVVCLVVVP